jgi:hypothetical protein
MKIINKITYILYFFTLLMIVILSFWSRFYHVGINTDSLFLWWLLLGWVYIVYRFKIKPQISIVFGLSLYVSGIIISVLGFNELVEFLFKLSYISWIIGLISALVYYKTRLSNKSLKVW